MRPNQITIILPLLLLLFSCAEAIDLGEYNISEITVATCNRTDYPRLCEYCAHTYSHKYPDLEPMSLLQMHLDMATDHTNSAKVVAQSFLTNERYEDGGVKDSFDVCISQYNDALDYLRHSIVTIRGGDAGTANTELSAAITSYSTCDDAFAEIPASNPMGKQDDFLMNMVSNALALEELVLKKN